MEEIIDQHPGEFFDHYDPDRRTQVFPEELGDYPLYDDKGNEVALYDENGHHVLRVLKTWDEEAPRLGIMMKLPGLAKALTSDPGRTPQDPENSEPQQNKQRPMLFPHSYFPDLGFAWTNSPLPGYSILSERINSSLGSVGVAIDAHGRNVPFRASPVKTTSHQQYSVAAHTSSVSHSQHEDHLGHVTAGLAGFVAETLPDQKKARKIQHRLSSQMPWEMIERKLTLPEGGASDSGDLRMEVVIEIDLQAMRPEDRKGW